MRLLFVILLIANLLLRGAAAPHAHAGPADAADHARRPHVHLAKPGGRHAHHDAGRDHVHRHAHRHAATDRGPADSPPGSAPARGHDADAVDVGDDAMMVAPAGGSASTRVAAGWLSPPHRASTAPPSLVDPRPRHVRPPGSAAATIHSLLPHVLRI